MDVSGNTLDRSVPELFSLKFLKKLNLSNNQITEVWALPTQIENLSLAYNSIFSFNNFPILSKLQTLDISYNNISNLEELSSLVNLKCLYAGNNKISSLSGIEKLASLLEVDLNDNLLTTRKDIEKLNLNTSIVVINIKNNPVIETFEHLKSGFVFSSVDEFPKDYIEICLGLYFRNPENLRKLKSSRYRSIIKQYKNQDKYTDQYASPDWGYSKCYNEITDFVDENLRSYDEKDRVQSEDSLKGCFREIRDSDEDSVGKKPIAIAKLHLEKISDKISYEKSSTKPESNLETLFEELISYCQIEEIPENEFSFSNEKYEYAVSVLKNRETERKKLILENSEVKAQNEILALQYSQAVEEKNIMQQRILDLENELKKQEDCLLNIMQKQYSLKQEKKSDNKSSFCIESLESHETEENAVKMNCSFESGLSSFSQLPDLSIASEFSRCISGNEYLVEKNVGVYIEKLLQKISGLVNKNKTIREAYKKLKKSLRTKE